MDIVIENRNCLSCGKVFRCSSNSMQKYHSKLCLETGPKWDGHIVEKDAKEIIVEPTINKPPHDHKHDPWSGGFKHDKEKQLKKKPLNRIERLKELKDVESRIENATARACPTILSFEKKSDNDKQADEVIPNSSKKNEFEQRQDMSETKNIITSNENSGERTMLSKTESQSANITPITKIDSDHKFTPEEKEEIQRMDFNLPNDNSELVKSQEMNLLDSTSEHLFKLMKGLTTDQDPSIRRYDSETVNAACNCAKNIREILKLKLEAIKVQRGL